jgi:beta-fructofuranosidase
MASATARDPLFPALHRVHPRGWINDPNGIVRSDGRWHVHFQHNPRAARHGDICWGHMSSPDLVRWREEPTVLVPRPGEADAGGCWSGVALFEEADDGRPALIYSGVDGVRDELGRVMLARTDGTMTRIEEPGHVVADVPDALALLGVRDPFVFEAFGRRWAIQGAGIEEGAEGGVPPAGAGVPSTGADVPSTGDGGSSTDGRGTPALLLYACDDLEHWELLGTLLTGEDAIAASHAPAEIWECPQLVRIGEDWVLLLSLWDRSAPGPTTVRTAYLVGVLEQDDRGIPRFAPRAGGPIDSGPDIYAPQAVQDREGDRVLLWGWSWEGEGRTEEQADSQGWAGCLTFPRELVLAGDRLLARVPRELEALRGDRLCVVDSAVQMLAPARCEVLAPRGAVVQILDIDGQVREEHVLGPDGSGEAGGRAPGPDGAERTDPSGPSLRLLVDGSILEAIGARTVPHTRRLYPEDGESVRISGPELRAWELRLPEA